MPKPPLASTTASPPPAPPAPKWHSASWWAGVSGLVTIIGLLVTLVLYWFPPGSDAPTDERHSPAPSPSATGRCVNPVPPKTAVAVEPALKTTQSGNTSLTAAGGAYTVELRRALTWAGLYLPLPTGLCRYELQLDARLLPPDHAMVEGEGWGYGIGPCNTWTGAWPDGFALQFAAYQGDERPRANPGTVVNPNVNDGRSIDLTVDYESRHWSVVVEDGRVTFSLNYGGNRTRLGPYQVAGQTGLPEDCHDHGIFLRVFNATVVFESISVVAL